MKTAHKGEDKKDKKSKIIVIHKSSRTTPTPDSPLKNSVQGPRSLSSKSCLVYAIKSTVSFHQAEKPTTSQAEEGWEGARNSRKKSYKKGGGERGGKSLINA